MSPEHRHIPEPGELVYQPRSLAVCGIFAEGFMVRGWIYSIIGGIVALFALRSMVKGATQDYFRLARRQHARGAVLPVEQISPPSP